MVYDPLLRCRGKLTLRLISTSITVSAMARYGIDLIGTKGCGLVMLFRHKEVNKLFLRSQ